MYKASLRAAYDLCNPKTLPSLVRRFPQFLKVSLDVVFEVAQVVAKIFIGIDLQLLIMGIILSFIQNVRREADLIYHSICL